MTAGNSVRIVNLSKFYGSINVLHGVNLEFRPGEVHAVLGANGAGKSTLLGCLSGAIFPTSGSIFINDREFEGFTPREALDAGISIIYQHFQLASTLSVSDNIFLGDELKTSWGRLKKRDQIHIASEVLAKIGLDIDPKEEVGNLSVGQQQGIEIARSVRREPRLLILDEPTAALGKHEVEAVLMLVRRLAHEMGVAVIFVTHLLNEVMEVADRVSILREGGVLWTRERQDVTIHDMIAGISPNVVEAAAAHTRKPNTNALVTLEDFSTGHCGSFNISIGEGEIVGIFGLLGSGRTDLLETIAGARQHWKGSLRLAGEELTYRSTSAAIKSGVSLVASDRVAQSLFASLTAQENLMMPHYLAVNRIWRQGRKERVAFDKVAEDIHLHPALPSAQGGSFSGGNAQKLMLGRWLVGFQDVRLLLLDEPTQGVDIGSRAQIYKLLRAFSEERPGRAVLFTTSDPEEAVALADRIIVLVNGQPEHMVEPPIAEAELISLAQSVKANP